MGERSAADLLAGIETFLRGEARKHRALARGRGNPVDLDDLYQAGALAALTVLPRYDPARCTFWTFAAPRVRGAMFDLIGGTLVASRNNARYAKAHGYAVPAVERLTGRHPAVGPPEVRENVRKGRALLWYARGKCVACGGARRKPTAQVCKRCSARQVRYSRKARKKQLALGLCRKPGCKSEPEPGRSCCRAHLAAWREYAARWRASNADKPPGVCTRGKCQEPTAPGRSGCERHLAMERERQRRHKARPLPDRGRDAG